ncbi:hypothetical protein B0H11DRAFT_2163930 [Mycena galericulata]|nr:hypothetical protein B0H11DRAFT_2163930 [Mycena galericulata]
MYVYVGKLNWFEYAQNECMTIVFPAGFALKDPVCAYWQWTVDAAGNAKSNCTQEGFITGVTNTTAQYYVRFPFSYYAFEGSVSANFSSLSLKMSNPQGETREVSLSLLRGDAVRVPSTSVFTGKLHWFKYSQNEMATLVIPGEVANGEPVILIHQWTDDGAGNSQVNHPVSGTLSTVNVGSNGDLSATFSDEYYTFAFTLRKRHNDVVLSMTDQSGEHDSRAPHYNLKQTDFRDLHQKKANIELSYFDVDPPTGPKQCTKGQDPPTAANFKSKFTQLCRSAVAGDVRFLYVDAHGTTYPDEDGAGEPDNQDEDWILAADNDSSLYVDAHGATDPGEDGQDEGWILAANNDGTRKEVVRDDWLGTCIRNNLANGVNLTILASSCMGGGMLDAHSATPGILLPGCHETQFSVKALKGMDPWMVAVTAVIKNNIRRKRGVPKYSVLFNDAKNFIRAQLASGQLSKKYRGPSPNEWQPIPRDQESDTSNQDPQLVFYNGYIDPEEERFLFPFKAPNGGHASGDATRYPQDEYPRDEL